jgi:hypothetical protein
MTRLRAAGRAVGDARFAWSLAAVLLLWGLLPLLAMQIYAAAHGGRATGAFSSLVVEDQFQYFAWIRESGNHVAISNLFDTAPAHHVFVLPPFLLSGALWRLGLPLQAAYHLWTVIGCVALAASVLAYMRRSFARTEARAASLIAVTFGAPAALFETWLNLTSSHGGDRLLAYVLSPMSAVWGYVPRLLAIAAMPAFFLVLESVLATRARRSQWIAAGLGAAVSWVHPWQGVILLLVLAGLAAWSREARLLVPAALPVLGVVAPLAYYAILRHEYADWHHASANPNYINAADLALVLAPFLALALLGVRRPGNDVHERILLLWPVATGLTFLAPTGGRFEAVVGLSIPLTVLCVRGWQRLRTPTWLTAVVAGVVVAAAVVPLVADATRPVRNRSGALWLHGGDRRAMQYLAESPARGGFLADSRIAAATVAFTGRRTWAAHASWSPQYAARAVLTNDAVAGKLPARTMEGVVVASRARFVFRDCGGTWTRGLRRSLSRLHVTRHAFGCAAIYELRGR